MKALVHASAVLVLLATAGLSHAQDSTAQPPAAQARADCPAPGSVPEAQLPENCKTALANPPMEPGVAADPAGKPIDQTTTTAAPEQPADQTTTTAAPEQPAAAVIDSKAAVDAIDPSSAFLASSFIGQTVYSTADENVGEINDLVMDKDQGAVIAIVGVGGFLGMGEKDVAVPLDRFTMTKLENNTMKLTINATRQELEAAPAFDRTRMSLASGG